VRPRDFPRAAAAPLQGQPRAQHITVHVSRATELPSRPFRPTSVVSVTVRGGTFDLVVSLSGAQERPFPFFVFDVLVPLPQCRSGYRMGRFVLVLLALMVGT
jgi:hypothetical protein